MGGYVGGKQMNLVALETIAKLNFSSIHVTMQKFAYRYLESKRNIS